MAVRVLPTFHLVPHRLTHAVSPSQFRPQMALRLWSRRATGLSRLLPSCPHRLLCDNSSTVKASSVVSSSAPEDGHSGAALEDAGPTSEKKKGRLSRQERTVLVESFVIKHMEAHGGAFPSVSAVLKETGGGRSAVKDILNDVESRLTSRETSPNSWSPGRTTNEGTMEKKFGVGSASTTQLYGQEDAMSDDSEDSDEEFDTEDVSDVETTEEELGGELPEAERKSVTFTNGQLIGSSHGEIETHSGLWSRLKKLGLQDTRRSTQQPTSQESPSVALNGESSDDSTKEENGVTRGGSVALGFSDVSDLDIKNTSQMEERHGLFVRYLSPQATPNDLKEAFSDCGEIVRAQAMKPRTHQKYTYGFVDFKTAEALQKALGKDKVYIKGVRIRKEPSSSTPKPSYRNVDISSTQSSDISYTEKHGDYNDNVKFKGKDSRERAGKTSVVRLSNVGAEVGAEQIQAACESIGWVEKVLVRRDGSFDVYFHQTELEKMPRIMSRLNEVKLGGQLLQAQPSFYIDTNSYLSLIRRKDGEEWLQQESERMLARVENTLKHLMVDVEDLQNLVKLRREHTP